MIRSIILFLLAAISFSSGVYSCVSGHEYGNGFDTVVGISAISASVFLLLAAMLESLAFFALSASVISFTSVLQVFQSFYWLLRGKRFCVDNFSELQTKCTQNIHVWVMTGLFCVILYMMALIVLHSKAETLRLKKEEFTRMRETMLKKRREEISMSLPFGLDNEVKVKRPRSVASV